MPGENLTDLEHEILDCLVDADETTRLVLAGITNPANAERFSAEAKELDVGALDRVFDRLADQGVVTRQQEVTDGFEHPRPGVTYTWWSITDRGRQAWRAWPAHRP